MKITFELQEDHRVLLQLLNDLGPLSYKDLQRLFYITRVEDDFKASARLITARDPATCFNEMALESVPKYSDETFRRILDGLTFVTLIKRLEIGELTEEESSRRRVQEEIRQQELIREPLWSYLSLYLRRNPTIEFHRLRDLDMENFVEEIRL